VAVPFKTTEYDRAFIDAMHAVVVDLARGRDPLMGQFKVETSMTVASSVVDSRAGRRLDLPTQSVGFGMNLDPDAVRRGDMEAFAVEVEAASEQYAGEMVGMMIQAWEKVTESTGNVVDAGGNLTFEHLYEALEKREWALNDADELETPQLVMHPDTAKKLALLPPMTPDQAAAVVDLRRRKREELLARRRRRRLS